MRIILVIAGILAALFVAHVGIWFAINVDDQVSVRFVLLLHAVGSLFGIGFWLAALSGRKTLLGRASRVFGLLMLIFPLWLFGSIAKAQFSRLWDGTDFRLLS